MLSAKFQEKKKKKKKQLKRTQPSTCCWAGFIFLSKLDKRDLNVYIISHCAYLNTRIYCRNCSKHTFLGLKHTRVTVTGSLWFALSSSFCVIGIKLWYVWESRSRVLFRLTFTFTNSFAYGYSKANKLTFMWHFT